MKCHPGQRGNADCCVPHRYHAVCDAVKKHQGGPQVVA
jgi:uncharacterized Fe-S center protein